MTDPRVEEIRARLVAATPGPWTVMIPDGEPYWIHSTGQTVLTKGIAFGDDAEFIANAPTDIALLLTKLDEAEKENAKLRGVNRALERRCLDAQGREVTLIAGVKEAERILGYGQRREARAILSRLLPSTPTEEGTNDDHS